MSTMALYTSPALVPFLFCALHLANASYDKSVQLLSMTVPLHVAAVRLNMSVPAWFYVLPSVVFVVIGNIGQRCAQILS